MEVDVSRSFLIAIEEADLTRVRNLVKRYRSSYRESWRNSYVFLCHAINTGQLETAKFLIQQGVQVNPKTAERVNTPLHCAVKENCLEIVQLLLDKNVSVDRRNGENETALHIAVKKGYADIVTALLDSNASVSETYFGVTPLLLAKNYNNEMVVDALLNQQCGYSFPPSEIKDREQSLRLLKRTLHGSDFNQEVVNQFVSQISAFNNDPSMFVFDLICRGTIHGRKHMNELLIGAAIESYYFTLFEHVLPHETCKSLDKYCTFILHTAVEKRLTEVVRLLLEAGFNPNAKNEKGETCLNYVLPKKYKCTRVRKECICSHEAECVEILRILFDNGADIKEAPHLLHSAIYKRLLNVCEVLIKEGADVNLVDSRQRTLLIMASQTHEDHGCNYRAFFEPNNSAEIAKLLLENGADLGVKSRTGRTAFHCAVRNGMTETARVFLDFGVDVDSKDEEGSSALHLAAQLPFEKDLVDCLCEKGADVNAGDKNGWRPLHVATFRPMDWPKTVETLLKFGADIHARGSKGETPLHCTCPNTEKILSVLLDNGSDINAVTNCGATPLDTSINAVENWGYSWSAGKLYAYLDEFNSSEHLEDSSDESGDASKKIYRLVPDDKGPGILKKHVIKLEVAELDVSERNLELVRRHRGTFPDSEKASGSLVQRRRSSFSEFRQECQEEIKRLKNVRLKPHFTLYDILAKRKNPTYVRNKFLMKTLKSFDFDPYPLYKSLILDSLKTSERKRLVELGKDGLIAIADNSSTFTCAKLCRFCLVKVEKCGLPDLVSEQIAFYLSDSDLKSLISCSNGLERRRSSAMTATLTMHEGKMQSHTVKNNSVDCCKCCIL